MHIDAEREIILNEIDRQWGQAKQSEDQRATLTNIIVVVAAASQGYVAEKNFATDTVVIASFLIMIGIFGLFATAKYYERFRHSMCRVGRLRERLDTMYPTLELERTKDRADLEHARRYPKLSNLRLNHLWSLMMVGIAALGIFDLAITVFRFR